MEQLISTLAELAGVMVAAFIVTQVKPLVEEWKLKIKNERLKEAIAIFVESVEQTLKEQDPTGAKRFAEVERLLEQSGYIVTDVIRSMIEAAVYNINLKN